MSNKLSNAAATINVERNHVQLDLFIKGTLF